MSEDCSHLRILIATVAFGMGVNCKKVRRTIHLDLQKTLNNMCKNQEELEGMVNKAHVCYCLMAFWPLAVKKKWKTFYIQKNAEGTISCITYETSPWDAEIGTETETINIQEIFV